MLTWFSKSHLRSWRICFKSPNLLTSYFSRKNTVHGDVVQSKHYLQTLHYLKQYRIPSFRMMNLIRFQLYNDCTVVSTKVGPFDTGFLAQPQFNLLQQQHIMKARQEHWPQHVHKLDFPWWEPITCMSHQLHAVTAFKTIRFSV